MKREVYSYRTVMTTLNITQNKVDSVRKKDITKTGCRVYENGFVGISGCFGEPTEETWKAAEENLELRIPYSYPLESGKVRTEDRREQMLTEQQFLEQSEAMLEQLSRENPKFIFSNKLFMVDVTETLTGEAGLRYEYKDRYYIFSVIFKHLDSNAVFDGGFGMEGRTFDTETFLRDAHCQLEAYQNPVELPEGKTLPVVLDFYNLGGKFQEGLSAEALGKGTSIFDGKLGKTLFSPEFTLSVDRSAENIGTAFFDPEGSTLEKDQLPLIENGVLKRGYCDKKNAAEFGFENTACADGGYDDVPSLGCCGFRLAPSGKTLAELLNGEEAILIDTMSGGDWTAEGNFASPVQLAYLVRDGKPVGRLPEFGLSGNLYELFGKDYRGVTADKPFFNDRKLVVNMKKN